MSSSRKRSIYDTLKDIYFVERQTLKALRKFAKAATSEKLKSAFLTDRGETEGHPRACEADGLSGRIRRPMERKRPKFLPNPSLLHSMADLRAVASGLWKIYNSPWNASLLDLFCRQKSSSPRAGAGGGKLTVKLPLSCPSRGRSREGSHGVHLHRVLEARRRG
jgi:hypothetical protein